jgi:hypothetical protein
MNVESIIQLIYADKLLTKLRKKIEAGQGTFKDTTDYCNRSAELLGRLFSENVLSMPDVERITANDTLLKDRYKDINDLLDKVQRTVDKKQGINIRPQHAPFNQERADQIGHSLTDKTVSEETIQRRAGSAPATMTRAMQDDYVEENAKFRSDAGLKTYLVRVTDGDCCEWCTKVAGRYEYGTEPHDIYRRHDNCGCSVTYENGRQRQNVWTKKTWEVPAEDAGAPGPVRLTKEQAAGRGASEPVRFTHEQARKLEAEKIPKKQRTPEQLAVKADEKAQYYRPVILNHDDRVAISRGYEFVSYKAQGTKNPVYVSENVGIKPKKLHQIDEKITESLEKMGISNKNNCPNVIVVSRKDMSTTDVAVYRPIENQLLICEDLAVYKPQNMPKIMGQLACGKNDLSSYIHELYHWTDAEEFRAIYGEITSLNYESYLDFSNDKSKKSLDKLAEKGYNIFTSKYAVDSYNQKRYYETYTEWRVTDLLN